jgi:hypothetical protein
LVPPTSPARIMEVIVPFFLCVMLCRTMEIPWRG